MATTTTGSATEPAILKVRRPPRWWVRNARFRSGLACVPAGCLCPPGWGQPAHPAALQRCTHAPPESASVEWYGPATSTWCARPLTQEVLMSMCRPPKSALKAALDAHFADNATLKSGAAPSRPLQGRGARAGHGQQPRGGIEPMLRACMHAHMR